MMFKERASAISVISFLFGLISVFLANAIAVKISVKTNVIEA